MANAATDTLSITESDVATPWDVLLWDDPVNTMEYVSKVLRKVFALSKEKAERLMMEAHTHGKTAAWSGEKSQAESYCMQLHGWGLNATLSSN